MDKTHFEELAAFIREHRSNESNFEKLYAKLEEEPSKGGSPAYREALPSIKTKAEEYQKAKETGGIAWPEFEKFVSEFEKAVMEALRE